MIKKIQGLIIVLIISLLAKMLNSTLLSSIETLTIGILLGLIYANTIGVRKSQLPGIDYSLKSLLKAGIVLLGVKLNYTLILALGLRSLAMVLILITLALAGVHFLGKKFHLPEKLSILMGVGSSICGASAIVAMGPVIGADDEDVTLSVMVISLLGMIGVILYSFVGTILPLSDTAYGLWAGSSLQGVAHALAAAGARGADNVSLEVGTLIKMARVAMLGPVALILGTIFSHPSAKKKVKIPSYLIYFLIVGLLTSFNDYFNLVPTAFNLSTLHVDLLSIAKELSSWLILMSMVAMGLKVHWRSFEKRALRALFVCSLIFVTLSLTSLAMVWNVR